MSLNDKSIYLILNFVHQKDEIKDFMVLSAKHVFTIALPVSLYSQKKKKCSMGRCSEHRCL